MRNSVEIYNLINITADVLGKQKTIFIHQKGSPLKSKVKIAQLEPGKNTLKESSLLSSDINTRRSRQTDSHEYHEEYSTVPQLGLDQAHTVCGSMLGAGDPNMDKVSKYSSCIFWFWRKQDNKHVSIRKSGWNWT